MNRMFAYIKTKQILYVFVYIGSSVLSITYEPKATSEFIFRRKKSLKSPNKVIEGERTPLDTKYSRPLDKNDGDFNPKNILQL